MIFLAYIKTTIAYFNLEALTSGGNIVTGTELIRKIDGGSAYAITTPLIQKADGTKFGKTESGNTLVGC